MRRLYYRLLAIAFSFDSRQSLYPDPMSNAVEPPKIKDSRMLLLVIGGLAVGGILGIVAALQFFVAQRSPELTEESLAAAEKLWERNGPASYDLDVEIRGNQPGLVHVEVRQGQVTAMQRDGVTPKQERVWVVWSVPGQFDTLERELELAADPGHEMQAQSGTQLSIRCEFDETFGYPRQYHRLVFGGGAEVYWRVTKFQSL